MSLSDYSPLRPCCSPSFGFGPDGGWFHDSRCDVAPGVRIAAEHGRCPIHVTEDLWTCRGCLATYDATHEAERERGLL